MTVLRRGHRVGAGLLFLLLAGCGSEPTGPEPSEMRIVPVAGDGAYGVSGEKLRLEAVVRGRSDGRPLPDVRVRWTVERGEASPVPDAEDGLVSDDQGVVWTRILLGGTPGPVAVRVAVEGDGGPSALLTVTVGDRPRLEALSQDVAAPGSILVLRGQGFSPRMDRDVVVFSGIRGRVVSAAPDRLEVVVPPCLPARPVEVTVQLGSRVSEPLALRVDEDGADVLALDPGGWLDVDAPADPACLRLEGGGRYLLVAASASTAAGGRFPLSLRGLSAASGPVVAAPAGTGVLPRDGYDPGPGGSFPVRWEGRLRERERALAGAHPPVGRGTAPAPGGAGPAGPPRVGDRRTFRVLNAEGALEDVTAEARHVGERAVIYVDEEAPDGGLGDGDHARLAGAFDQVVFPAVREAFGAPSDLDGNGRVIILFTPVVNRLSPRGSDGFVGGFFYALDLLEGAGGNDGEVFYALVPDPEGLHSDPRSTERVLEAVPAVLAHELQHMVHFHQRALAGGAGTGALWVSEGLAQMAEEVVARRYEELGDPAAAEGFREGNRKRARRYLGDPGAVSLVVGSGRGSLAERGGGWLFLLYLADRWGGAVLADLTRTPRTGVENVTAATATAWDTLLGDWWSALHVGGSAAAGAYPFSFRSVGLRTLLAPGRESWPLEPVRPDPGDFSVADTLWSASARHYLVEPPSGSPLVVRLAGPDGGPAPAGSALALRIVRLF